MGMGGLDPANNAFAPDKLREEAIRSRALENAAVTNAQGHMGAADIMARASTDNAETTASTQLNVEGIRSGYHKYAADRQLEGYKYAADQKDPYVDQYGEPIPVPGLAEGGPAQARRPYLVGENGPELMVPDQSGTIIPNNRLRRLQSAVPRALGGPVQPGGEPVRRSVWIQRQREAAQEKNTRLAHEGPNKLIDFQISEKMREHNLAAFNAKVDAMYPGPVNEKTGKPGVSPEAESFKRRYQSMAEMDPKSALEAVGGAMKLTSLVNKYKTPEGVDQANQLLQAGKIDAGLYKQLVGGDPATAIAVESRFMQNQDAARLHPGLLTGQPTPSGMPGLTAPGNPDSTPGIHTTAAGDKYRVSMNPDGTRTEQLIGRAPAPEQLEKWKNEYAQTPEGQFPPGTWKGADGNIYKANRNLAELPTMIAQPVGPAPVAQAGTAAPTPAPGAPPQGGGLESALSPTMAPSEADRRPGFAGPAPSPDPAVENWRTARGGLAQAGRDISTIAGGAAAGVASGAEGALNYVNRGAQNLVGLATGAVRQVVPGAYQTFPPATAENPMGLPPHSYDTVEGPVAPTAPARTISPAQATNNMVGGLEGVGTRPPVAAPQPRTWVGTPPADQTVQDQRRLDQIYAPKAM